MAVKKTLAFVFGSLDFLAAGIARLFDFHEGFARARPGGFVAGFEFGVFFLEYGDKFSDFAAGSGHGCLLHG
jgi:hypothetical protein